MYISLQNGWSNGTNIEGAPVLLGRIAVPVHQENLDDQANDCEAVGKRLEEAVAKAMGRGK
jgi:hypothetical protein